jgi:Zn-dependent protease with chaperone function
MLRKISWAKDTEGGVNCIPFNDGFMSRYFQAALVLLYVLLTILAFEVVLAVSGWRLSVVVQWWLIVGWVGFCFVSAYVWAGVYTFLHSRYRKPLGPEEVQLAPAMAELLAKAGRRRRVRVWIDASPEMNAYATGYHTIAISRGLLAALSPEELRGVLAHELGHLLSGDTIVATAFLTAGLLPKAVFGVCRVSIFVLRSALRRVNILVGVLVLLGLGFWLDRVHLLKGVAAVLLFVGLFMVLNRVFKFIALFLGRLAEYRQDAFAFKLGYGEGLRSALGRLAASAEAPVSRYFIVMHSRHPVIAKRIRRLEKMT